MASHIVSPPLAKPGRKRWAGIIVGAAALVFGLGTVMSGSGLEIVDRLQASVSKSWQSIMSNRSPGKRTTAKLTKIKHKKIANRKPHQRALGKIRRPLPAPFLRALVPDSDFAPASINLNPYVGVTLPQLALADLPPVSVPGGVPGIPGIGTPGGGISISTPGGSTPVTPPPVVIPTPTPAVPEPGTWAMMLLGFGMIGLSLRRRDRRIGSISTVA